MTTTEWKGEGFCEQRHWHSGQNNYAPCNKPAKLVEDPYDKEINGTTTMVWLCDDDYQERAWDV